MASKNDITLDTIWNRPTEKYRENLENIDFSVKLTDEADTPAEQPKEIYRYLEVKPTAFNFVSMAYPHPDHNLKMTFDSATGALTKVEIINE